MSDDGVLDSILAENAALKAALDDLGDYGDLRTMRADLANTREALQHIRDVAGVALAEKPSSIRTLVEGRDE